MRTRKRPPVHPGRILNNHYLTPLSLTKTKAAIILGVSRKTVSKLVNEHAAVTSDMALRLSRAFKTTPEFWLNLQKTYDLWYAMHETKGWMEVRPVEMQAI